MSKKLTGANSILYTAALGTLVTTGTLIRGTTILTGWYKIAAFGESTALPDLKIGSIFQTPAAALNDITLSTGDEVYPITLTEVCKVDTEVSGEMGTVDATDSCDWPYTVNLPDGFVNLSGTINTMLRFDDDTEELVSVTEDFLVKFFDIVYDDGENLPTLTPMDDSDVLLFILMNSRSAGTAGIVSNYIITPAVLTSNSMPNAMKDVMKADYSWSKGQGPAMIYKRLTPAA